MSEEKILLYEKQNDYATITLNRPDKLNAFNDELSFQLQDALKEAEKDTAVRAVVLTGAGRGFCSGQDLANRNFSDNTAEKPSLADSLRRRYNPIILRLRQMEKPVNAAINGVAAGAGAARRGTGRSAGIARNRAGRRLHAARYRRRSWPVSGRHGGAARTRSATR